MTSFWSVIVQILLLDIVFSLDSVITAAVVIAVGFMLVFANAISGFVERHPW